MAGRDREKSLFASSLETLQSASGAAQHVVLVGPRRCGKTSLMIWLGRHIHEVHPNIRVQKITTALPETQGFIAAQVLKGAYRSKLPDRIGVRFDAGVASAEASWSLRGSEAELIAALKRACAKNPLVLLVDETQSCSGQGLHHLFNLLQDVNSDTRNVFAVFAGTPAITDVLHEISAMFYNRTEKVGVGLIDTPDAESALLNPIEGAGCSIENRALDQLVATCQGFPYFLQKAGQITFDLSQAAGAKRIVSEQIDAVIRALEGIKVDSYVEREADWDYEDIPVLAGVVRRVASLVQARKLTKDDLIVATEAELTQRDARSSERAVCMVRKMHNTGMFWQPPKRLFVSAGLPSFASYIVERAQARDRSRLTDSGTNKV